MSISLDHTLQYVEKPESRLYKWAINEIGKDGKVLGGDQIPWGMGLYFTATEIVLNSESTIKEEIDRETAHRSNRLGQKAETIHRYVIRAKLQSGYPQRIGSVHNRRHPKYRMFGTDRLINDFTLEIIRLSTEEEIEHCVAYGGVSFDVEIDFEPAQTVEDSVSFYLMVKPSTFDHYAARIAAGTADELILSVEFVSGFYSDWSPSIFTSDVKVLANDVDNQKLQTPADLEYQPPRLGNVGGVTLSINARREQIVKKSDIHDYQRTESDNKHQPLASSKPTNLSNGIAPQALMPLGSPQRSNAITYRLGWAIWWLSLVIALPALLLCGWGIANYLQYKTVDLFFIVVGVFAALAVVGFGRLMRYVLSGD